MKVRFLSLALLAVVAAGAGLLLWRHPGDADRLFAEGRAAIDANELELAGQKANELQNRDHVEHHRVLRAAIWLREGRNLLDRVRPDLSPAEQQQLQGRAQQAFRLAIELLSQCRAEDPLAVEATLIGGECLIRTGEYRLPAEALRAVVRRQPDRIEAHRLLAAIYVEIGARNEAVQHYREWARLDPEDGRPYRWIGYFHKGQNKFGEAAQAYEEGSRRQLTTGVRAEVLREWAESLIEGQAAFARALEVLEQAPDLYKRTPEIHTLQAECLWGLGKTKEAIERIDAVLQQRPNMPRALSLRARIHLAQDQPSAAAPLLEKVLQLDAHEVGSRQNLMEAHQRLGDQAQAERQGKLLEESRGYKNELTRLHGEATLRPWDDRVRLRIAELCLKIDRPAEAHMWLRACLAVNRGNVEALKRLEALQSSSPKAAAPGPLENRPEDAREK